MDKDQRRNSRVFSKKVRAGKRRTYFFDVRETKGGDYFITLTESTKKFNEEGFERHKIFLYKEDFNRFLDGLNEAVDHVKNDLLPDYDFEEFDKIHAEYEEMDEKKIDSKVDLEEPKKEEETKSNDDSISIDW